jgi:ammonia channel protein AmtB
VVVVGAFAFVGSYLLLKLIGLVTELRVSPEEEEKGLDRSSHGERAYVGEANDELNAQQQLSPDLKKINLFLKLF